MGVLFAFGAAVIDGDGAVADVAGDKSAEDLGFCERLQKRETGYEQTMSFRACRCVFCVCACFCVRFRRQT